MSRVLLFQLDGKLPEALAEGWRFLLSLLYFSPQENRREDRMVKWSDTSPVH
jgi:hypothetical protein